MANRSALNHSAISLTCTPSPLSLPKPLTTDTTLAYGAPKKQDSSTAGGHNRSLVTQMGVDQIAPNIQASRISKTHGL
jgi:hypothetical protein